MSGIALATRGMLQPCCKQDQIISLDQPDVQAVLEVRPRIRHAAAPSTGVVVAPVVTGAQEMRPSTGVESPATPSPDLKPTQTSAQELRPVTTKVEED